MNKEQVKIALECCTSRENKCSKCPYQRPFECRKIEMIQDALRLINEQEANIEMLKMYNDKLSQGIYYGNGEHLCDRLNKAKKQAVKEFAEKVKDYLEDKLIDEFGDGAVDTTYLTIDIDEFEDYVDELLKEYEK